MLERLLRVRSLILHKTERLQFSKKGISSVIPFWNADENKVLLLAASAHKYSHDPLARIILEEAKKKFAIRGACQIRDDKRPWFKSPNA